MDIIDKLTDAIKTKKITDPKDVKGELKLIIEEILTNDNSTLDVSHSPSIIVMVGVNGVGKTTLLNIIKNLIINSSNKGDIVLDCFSRKWNNMCSSKRTKQAIYRHRNRS